MRKVVRTPEELNALLTAELRRVPGCEGAAWVRVYRLRKHVRGKNWLAAFLAPGGADKRDCARALIEIERRLQTEFDLAPEPFKRERSRPFLVYRRYHQRLPSQLLPQYAAPTRRGGEHRQRNRQDAVLATAEKTFRRGNDQARRLGFHGAR